MKKPLVLWKCLVSKTTVNKETLMEDKLVFLRTAEDELQFHTPFCILSTLHASTSDPFHVCILVLQAHLPVPSNTFPAAPSGTCSRPKCSPCQVFVSSLCSDWTLTQPLLLCSVAVSHCCEKHRVFWLIWDFVGINWQASYCWQRWTVFPLTGCSKSSFLYPNIKLGKKWSGRYWKYHIWGGRGEHSSRIYGVKYCPVPFARGNSGPPYWVSAAWWRPANRQKEWASPGCSNITLGTICHQYHSASNLLGPKK